MTETITIASGPVKINDEGMYCINDLHRRSGGESKHMPKEFFRRLQTIEIIKELESPNCGSEPPLKAVHKSPGRYGGTYVCKELVYTYAMWVSPIFHIEVIRFFDSNKKVRSGLESLVNNVEMLGESLSNQLDATSLTIDEMNQHGSNWGNYGVAIRKTKKECRRILEDLKDRIQMKLDFS